MNHLLTKSISFLCIFLCLIACKKDGGGSDREDDQKINGGDIIRYRLVTIDVGDITLSKEQYQGKIGPVSIPLVKADDRELAFILLENIPEGNQELIIPELNNMRITYTVKDPVLTKSAGETIAPLLTTFTRFADNMADGTESNALLLHNLRNVVDIYENASSDQQRIMAMSYQANKTMFDEVFRDLDDIRQSRVQRQSTASRSDVISEYDLRSSLSRANQTAGIGRGIKEFVSDQLFRKFARCILIMGGTAYLSVQTAAATTVIGGVTLGASGLVSAALLGVAVAYAIEAVRTFGEITDLTLTKIWVSIKEGLGLSSHVRRTSVASGSGGMRASGTGSSDALVLYHDVAESVPMYVAGSKLQQSDRNNSSALLQTFFTGFDKLVSMKETINEGLAWCNENVAFANFNLLPIETIPAESEEEQIDTPVDILDYLSFSIDHANLQLVDVSLTEAGELSIKVNIVNSQEESIKGELKYVYKDDFSSFEETVPIEVKKEEEYNYQIQIGDYNPDYNLISPQQTILQGGSLTLPNYTTQMVRLILDGQPVNVGQYGLPWTQISFGAAPVSSESIYHPSYTFTIRDQTNNRNVTFNLDLTLTNEAYAQLVGKRLKINENRYVTFNADGTCSALWEDGGIPTSGPTRYTWQTVISPSYQDCYEGVIITTKVIGAIYLPEGNGVTLPSHIMIEEGGGFRSNSHYGCPNRFEYIPIE